MKDDDRFSAKGLRGVLIPVGTKYLLLPNAAVAEIIPFRAPTPKLGSPPWLLGSLEWRGLNIPVLAWERLVEDQEPKFKAQRNRISIINTLNKNQALSHIGVLNVGVSQLTRIRADMLSENNNETIVSPLIQASIIITGQAAWIPDLDELERQVIACLN